MCSGLDDEKKGLIPASADQLQGLIGTYQILSIIQERTPLVRVEPYISEQKSSKAALLDPNDLQALENIDPSQIVMTTEVKLMRAELPLTFDVVSLTRGAAEDETTISQTQILNVDGAESDAEDADQ